MGIPCWFPRTTLAGAGASHHLDVAVPAPSRPTLVEPADVRKAGGGRVPNALRAALPSETQQKASFNPPVAPSVSVPVVEDEPAPAFAFSWFNVDPRLSVLAMLPAGADCLTSACRQMLQRILVALNAEFKEAVGHEHTFHWPFPGDLGLPTGHRAARQAVDGFVARRRREQPSALLLILADETPPFLYGDNSADGEDQHGHLIAHRQFGFAMLRTHSLHAMEADGALKRSAWQAMQSIRDRLQRGAG
tara:strand:- start:805 stop:1548 length:744 start_codon:yes stop_codon:yes gene_type:complete